MPLKQILINRPDDMHLHLRDGSILDSVISHTSRFFGRAVVMPNLLPPITTIAMARLYRDKIYKSLEIGHDFKPLMTLYLTEFINKKELVQGFQEGLLSGVKLYPAGATTNSDSGVSDIEKVFPIFEVMENLGLPLLIHGEVVDSDIDIFDREKVFIDRILIPMRKKFPELRIVLEHVTTEEGVKFVAESQSNICATITPHHLVLNRTDMFRDGINPHNYCLPILKKEHHRIALIEAATSGDSRFFLGTDSAPHTTALKESSCGCAGIFNAPNTLGILASVFEEKGALDMLEAFTSLNGCNFYNLEVNKSKILLVKESFPVEFPSVIQTLNGQIKVFDPGFQIFWHVKYPKTKII